eukprot:TRINITY_DN8222_c0_g3_i1.p1 TRINITY_DN8222_c0_g3~~TRINITY_DN8222_c0_g3_i1.p1  ORF type:complete len:2481 (+),score=387.79 TRINITY_DN8222_c0_g3_i1:143-7585(+)
MRWVCGLLAVTHLATAQQQAPCDVAADCSGHASAASGTVSAGCTCVCVDRWTGSDCSVCPPQYDGAAGCNACSGGRTAYPSCWPCSIADVPPDPNVPPGAPVADRCFGNQVSVGADAAGTGCVCVCKVGYEGDRCESCAAGYHVPPGYPACWECTNAGHCSGHARNVSDDGSRSSCVCDCRNQWAGASCDTCPVSTYDPSDSGDDCGACAYDYVDYGFGLNGICTRCPGNLSLVPNGTCNGNEEKVTAISQFDCGCKCKPEFEGLNCERCSPGHIQYPSCVQCTSAVHCSGHAVNVTDGGMRQVCLCAECRAHWHGAGCELCESKFDNASDCASCAPGHVDYPICTECTNAVHCSGNAASVSDDGRRRYCACQCKPFFDASLDCSACVVGAIGYPTCTECSVAAHCSGRASSATDDGARARCVCACTAEYAGDSCQLCAAGRIQYPTCTLCTSVAHCSGHSSSVAPDATQQNCVCACEAEYAGASCAECAAAHVGYPTCRACSVAADCSGHATGVASNTAKTDCVCSCSAGFEPPACAVCSVGHIGYPSCTVCSIAADCGGRATAATDDGTRTRCVCTCEPQYGGASCGECAAGYHQFPGCAECTNAVHCNSRAAGVTSDASRTSCVCSCRSKWSPPTCLSCPSQYAGVDCDECAAGSVSFPTCTPCGAATHCNSHASSVSPNGNRDACVCQCRNQWTTDAVLGGCGLCPANFGGADCDECSQGRIDYPLCGSCSSTTHCSGNAASVSPNPTQSACVCACAAQWVGSRCDACPSQYGGACDQCAVGRISYPACTACDLAVHCMSRATTVTDDGLRSQCVCACRNAYTGGGCGVCPGQFGGSDCDQCAAGRVGYPNCTECTVAAHCGGHASASAPDPTATRCVCVCLAMWSGATCSSCPPAYGGSGCDECAAGHVGPYPSCRECTSAADCSGHAAAVTDDGTRASCSCTCQGAYSGPSCAECSAAHYNYPTCDACTSAAHCNGRAASVTDDGTRASCVCSCRTQWSGSSCSTCPPSFDSAADCGECAVGSISYPLCTQCSSATHCSSHAHTVSDDGTRTVCACSCTPEYSGAACDSCAAGYYGYPACLQCTIAQHCSGHATTATSDPTRTSCVCTCRSQWTSADCSVCPSVFGGADCDECADGYITYPRCDMCTDAAHCSGHSLSVTSHGNRVACECHCGNAWTGQDCSVCPSHFSGADCDACAQGYAHYPICGECDNATHCSNHASAVSSAPGGTACVCTCRNQWTGARCDTCPTQFGGADCDTCSRRHVSYPLCTQCTSAAHCGGRAVQVDDDGSRSACVCHCRSQWSGPQCGTCPPQYGGADCGECSAGHAAYPTCGLCTQANCSGNAAAVSSTPPFSTCSCTCRNRWTGPVCDTCPPEFGGAMCDECAAGRILPLPACVECTSSAHCSGHATSVSDDGSRAACVCVCEPGFSGAACGTCASGYFGWPVCTHCTSVDHCSGHAATVTDDGTRTGCACTCRSQWSGPSCSGCPAAFDAAADCGECSVGHVLYPNCSECTSAAHCSSHAAAVSDDGARVMCVCSCLAAFTGPACSTCAVGYFGYPVCGACSVVTHCGSHAVAVTSDVGRTGCVCTCRNQWSGAQCGTCISLYAGTDCDQCTTGFYGYPVCRQCTSAAHCRDRAATVSSNVAQDGCVCVCRNQWSGASCGDCPSVFAGADCDACASGLTGFPICGNCSVRSHCSGHATAVQPLTNLTACECTCANRWTGDRCDVCPPEYGGAGCDACASGFIVSPGCMTGCSCVRCTLAVHCSAGAASVGDDGTRHRCVCSCRNSWTGDRCQLCPAEYAGADCGECATGHVQYPGCRRCDVVSDCNARAVSVTSDPAGTMCVCTCRNQWAGADCGSCPGSVGGADCDACAAGRVGPVPQCRMCDVAADCGGNAAGVSDDGQRSACVCRCSAGYDGAACGECAAGYVGYPTCVRCTSANDCGGRAAAVTSDSARTLCICSCAAQWEGADCGTCEPRYRQPGCDSCAESHVGYPSCRRCDVAADCGGRASAATDDGTRTRCVCTCDQRYGGERCGVCAPGRAGFPSCALCTSAGNCSSNAAAAAPDAAAAMCVCTCRNQWRGSACESCMAVHAGSDCDACAEGLIGYPNCVLCTVTAHCSGNAVGVISNGARTECVCACSDQWSGAACGTCPPRYAGRCDQCAGGFTVYPICGSCTVAANCSGNALSATPTASGCDCECRGKWGGVACEVCPSELDPAADCADCAAGYVRANCTAAGCSCARCSSSHCSGHSVSATDDGSRTRCVCTCASAFTGADCGECAEGHVGYPVCRRCDAAADCGGRASVVATDAGRTRCVCGCKGGWSGPSCGDCPAGVLCSTPTATLTAPADDAAGAAAGESGERGSCLWEVHCGLWAAFAAAAGCAAAGSAALAVSSVRAQRVRTALSGKGVSLFTDPDEGRAPGIRVLRPSVLDTVLIGAGLKRRPYGVGVSQLMSELSPADGAVSPVAARPQL